MTYKHCSPLNLGVLGGGQLGRMLIAPALRLGIRLHFLDKRGTPCQDCSPFFYEGSFMESQDILNFAKKFRDLDTFSIEIENVNTAALTLLEEEGKRVRPSAYIINLVQDKLTQKQFYQKHNFPSSELIASIENKAEIESHLGYLPAVQKIRCSGYDGYGVKFLSDKGDMAKAFDVPSILEKKIDFCKEIAVILARDSHGRIVLYPAVEMVLHPTENILEYLFCPADLDPQIQKRAYELASDLAESLALVGLLAVEIFLTEQGELLINEIAPRPHNSGHHTIELCPVSQFEQHLRAVFDLPLGDTSCQAHAATLNLLGQEGNSGTSSDSAKAQSHAKAACQSRKSHEYRGYFEHYQGLAETLQIPGVFLHLYGKKEVRPFRKMGHITVIAESSREVHKKMQRVREKLCIQA